MELRKINTEDVKAQWEYTTNLPSDENGLTNPYNGVSYDEYVEKVLPAMISYEHPINMPDWFVQSHIITFGMEEGLLVSFGFAIILQMHLGMELDISATASRGVREEKAMAQPG